MDESAIIFQSLVGSQIDVPRFTAVQNELMKHVAPAVPFLPFKNQTTIESAGEPDEVRIWGADAPLPASEQFFPFTFELPDGQQYLLPYEPMVSISGKNNIVRRNVAKAHGVKNGAGITGTIKERWSQGDYEITITGVLMGSIMTGDVSQCYPKKDFEKLKTAMTAPQRLRVYCEPLQLLGINYIVIEDFTFPFTKGENVQAYNIKAYSDFDYKLLLELND